MYHSPPTAPRNVAARPLPLGWMGYGLLAAVPSALAALSWLARYEAMPRRLRMIVEAIMLGGMALSAICWLALGARSSRWYSGLLVLGAAWGIGYSIASLSYRLFDPMSFILHIQINPIEGYIIDWSIVIGATAIGLGLACAQGYLFRRPGLAGRAALLLTALGNTMAWIGLFPLLMGGYIA
jgi:hypothetical protein